MSTVYRAASATTCDLPTSLEASHDPPPRLRSVPPTGPTRRGPRQIPTSRNDEDTTTTTKQQRQQGGTPLHGVLITFDCAAPADDVAAPFAEYAAALQQQPGLISKTWIVTDDGYGGFHVFADRAAADGYLASELAAGLMATDGFDNFDVHHFPVLDDLSAMTGVHPDLMGRLSNPEWPGHSVVASENRAKSAGRTTISPQWAQQKENVERE